jgi:hypothetical protein
MKIAQVTKLIRSLMAEGRTYGEILNVLLHTDGVTLRQIGKTLSKTFNAL